MVIDLCEFGIKCIVCERVYTIGIVDAKRVVREIKFKCPNPRCGSPEGRLGITYDDKGEIEIDLLPINTVEAKQ